jgi:chromosome segregation ATPase
VLVVAPRDLDGARLLRSAGATVVRVVEGPRTPAPGLDVTLGWPEPHERFDLVVAVETYDEQERSVRLRWLQHAAASLSEGGWFAARAPHGATSGVDFWTLEEELGERFPHVYMLAELPWQGVSLAPVLDGHDVPSELALDESLVVKEPDASHYLALASTSAPSEAVLRRITERCLLVPSASSVAAESVSEEELTRLHAAVFDATALAQERGERVIVLERELERRAQRVAALEQQQAKARDHVADQAAAQSQLEAAEVELGRAREQARTAQTDITILSRTVADLEAAVARANESSSARQAELDTRDAEVTALRGQLQSLDAERASVVRQMEVALAEREGTHKLAQRVEAELELARRRLGQHEDTLALRIEEVAKLTTDLEVTRAELDHQRSLLAQAQTREEALSAEAAQTVEQGRMLAEVAGDRDRLREELGRRGQQIQRLEERLWASREELEKARLDNVRTASDAERSRERAERAHQSEAKQAKDLERLGAELHQLELQRAELRATVRAHEEEIGRLREASQARTTDDTEVAALRSDVAERARELADARARQQQLEAREQEAVSVARRREQQLSEVGEELERLRRAAEQNAATASTLEGELEVKALEVEQLAASVSDLQAELEVRREAIEATHAREEGLQRDLEHARGEQESLRRRLREREQELEDITSANENSGVELYKLRRELEAAAEANEQLEQALEVAWPSDGHDPTPAGASEWPLEAVDALRRLKAQLAAQARRHAEQIALRSQQEPASVDRRVERYRLEAQVRAEEQEHMLRELDAAEQKIWEMTDAADRNAARLAASLAQLEKHKEELDETRDELEVSRKLLAAAEARALEQERLLASERARLARVGAGPDPDVAFDEVDDLFADLAGEGDMVELGAAEEGAPVRRLRPESGPKAQAGAPEPVGDSGSGRVSEDAVTRAPRVVVESLDDEVAAEDGDGPDDPWETGVVSAPHRAAADGTDPGLRSMPSKKA